MAPNKTQPALLGGLFIGVLSALPFINALNACCCLWVVIGGVLASYLMQQGHPHPITVADGALVGLLAGLFGGVLGTILSIPIDMVMGPIMRQWLEGLMETRSDMPDEMRDLFRNLETGPLGIAFKFVSMTVTGAIFGLLGGMLGAAMFKKSAPPPPGTVDVLPPTPPLQG
jgi:hypothetical protein